jgi:tRNA U34 5-methylaminomethyl-2-thiouridine-forming methyltransferase MnmC
MKPELIITGDGSHTVSLSDGNVMYHSRHGAVQESMHVFIGAGLHYVWNLKTNIRILEMGLGTGLNALLTCMEADRQCKSTDYHCIEAFPIGWPLVAQLNYPDFLNTPDASLFLEKIHTLAPEVPFFISPFFSFTLHHTVLQDFVSPEKFDLIYFDAFAPETQPELWTEEIFKKLFCMTAPGGILVTYCSKGIVRRAMQAAGYTVDKLPGPPGKREIVRAIKLT